MARFIFNPVSRTFNLVQDAVDLGESFQGPYESGVTYTLGQSVLHDENLYVCLQETLGNLPSNPAFWGVLRLRGPVGPTGETGPVGPASDTTHALVAGEALARYRMVVLNAAAKVIHADHTELAHAGHLVGITVDAAAVDEEVRVCSFGVVSNLDWAWEMTQPAVFLATSGQLSQTPPTSGFSCVVGHVFSETQLFIRIQPSTILVDHA